MEKELRPKVILGFVGFPCVGKGVAIDYLVKNHGFYYSSLSDRIREESRRRNLEITRENLQNLAGELREKLGPEILAKRTWERVLKDGFNKVVVDAIRGKEEAEFFKKISGFYLVAISSSQKIRFQRMLARGRESDPITWEEFLRMEEKDNSQEGRNIQACLQMADFEIENNGTVEELAKRLEKLIKRLRL